MSVIGKKILSVLNNSHKRKPANEPLIPFNESSQIGILYTWEGSKKEQQVTNFTEILKDQKTIDILCFSDEKKESVETNRPVISVEDLSLLGKINSSVAESFTKKQFDFLFHLDFRINEITSALLIKSQAKCRVGIHSEDGKSLYELMIGIEQSAGIEHLTEQMLKYVKALK